MLGQAAGDASDSWTAEDGAACDTLPIVTENTGTTRSAVRFYKPTKRVYFYRLSGISDSITSMATWKAWLAEHPISVVYPLAEPVTVQLDRQQMPALRPGTNTFWSDTGGVDVVYYSIPADPTNPTEAAASLSATPTLSMAAPPAEAPGDDEPEEVEER